MPKSTAGSESPSFGAWSLRRPLSLSSLPQAPAQHGQEDSEGGCSPRSASLPACPDQFLEQVLVPAVEEEAQPVKVQRCPKRPSFSPSPRGSSPRVRSPSLVRSASPPGWATSTPRLPGAESVNWRLRSRELKVELQELQKQSDQFRQRLVHLEGDVQGKVQWMLNWERHVVHKGDSAPAAGLSLSAWKVFVDRSSVESRKTRRLLGRASDLEIRKQENEKLAEELLEASRLLAETESATAELEVENSSLRRAMQRQAAEASSLSRRRRPMVEALYAEHACSEREMRRLRPELEAEEHAARLLSEELVFWKEKLAETPAEQRRQRLQNAAKKVALVSERMRSEEKEAEQQQELSRAAFEQEVEQLQGALAAHQDTEMQVEEEMEAVRNATAEAQTAELRQEEERSRQQLQFKETLVKAREEAAKLRESLAHHRKLEEEMKADLLAAHRAAEPRSKQRPQPKEPLRKAPSEVSVEAASRPLGDVELPRLPPLKPTQPAESASAAYDALQRAKALADEQAVILAALRLQNFIRKQSERRRGGPLRPWHSHREKVKKQTAAETVREQLLARATTLPAAVAAASASAPGPEEVASRFGSEGSPGAGQRSPSVSPRSHLSEEAPLSPGSGAATPPSPPPPEAAAPSPGSGAAPPPAAAASGAEGSQAASARSQGSRKTVRAAGASASAEGQELSPAASASGASAASQARSQSSVPVAAERAQEDDGWASSVASAAPDLLELGLFHQGLDSQPQSAVERIETLASPPVELDLKALLAPSSSDGGSS